MGMAEVAGGGRCFGETSVGVLADMGVVDVVDEDDDLVPEGDLVEDIMSGGSSGGEVGHVCDEVTDRGCWSWYWQLGGAGCHVGFRQQNACFWI